MDILIQRFNEKYAAVKMKTVRKFMETIDWSNRFIGIRGSRGVGKTTLLLQYIKQHYKPGSKVLYVSLDHFYFTEHKLYDLADQFYKTGGELLAVDEVHRYPNWSIELKNIYDDFQNLKVIFTGSSLLHLHQTGADLSRRAVMYSMPGLSFREYLIFETNLDLPVYSLEQILTEHVSFSVELLSTLKPLAYFQPYLNHGYYPFYLENKSSYHQKLNEVIQVVLDVDIPQFENLQTSNIQNLKRLLQIIAASVPFKPNFHSMSERTGISINTMKAYLKNLQSARLITMVQESGKGLNSLAKPDKIFLQNTNLMYALVGDNWDKGNIRETFFLTQLSEFHKVNTSKQTDFQVDEKYNFEIGGKSKSKKQIQGLPLSFVVKDDIESGFDNIIPLWLFGFLY